MSLLLQVLAVHLATSMTLGPLIGVAVGRLIRHGDRRRRHEVGLLASARAAQPVPHDA